MSDMHEYLRERHTRVRKASAGADVSLVSQANGFSADFECAQRIHALCPGAGRFTETGDGILEPVSAALFIPLKDMPRLMRDLEPHVSVALLDVHVEGPAARHCAFFVQRVRNDGATTKQAAAPATDSNILDGL